MPWWLHSNNALQVPLGCVTHGVCRHRAVLYKYLCDFCHIPCRLVRGACDSVHHAWNGTITCLGSIVLFSQLLLQSFYLEISAIWWILCTILWLSTQRTLQRWHPHHPVFNIHIRNQPSISGTKLRPHGPCQRSVGSDRWSRWIFSSNTFSACYGTNSLLVKIASGEALPLPYSIFF